MTDYVSSKMISFESNNIRMSLVPLYEVKLYLGCEQNRLSDCKLDRKIPKNILITEIGKFQENYEGTTVPVRVTDTTFISDTDYLEDGWEISAINYPRTNHSHGDVLDFMLDLAEYLLQIFLQKRICVLDCGPTLTDSVYMLEGRWYDGS